VALLTRILRERQDLTKLMAMPVPGEPATVPAVSMSAAERVDVTTEPKRKKKRPAAVTVPEQPAPSLLSADAEAVATALGQPPAGGYRVEMLPGLEKRSGISGARLEKALVELEDVGAVELVKDDAGSVLWVRHSDPRQHDIEENV
jgi:hypothetical protein